MSLAKVVVIKAHEGKVAAVDAVLSAMALAAGREGGTRVWEAYPGEFLGDRVIVEVYDDAGAAKVHDASAAVAWMAEQFNELLERPPHVVTYTRERHIGRDDD